MGGFIAYNGDLWGRKLGKRRMSLFGLRPRNTAILITSGFGVLISLFTTGILFLVVPQVREVMLNGEEAIRLKYVLTSQNRRYQAENQRVRSENVTLTGEQ